VEERVRAKWPDPKAFGAMYLHNAGFHYLIDALREVGVWEANIIETKECPLCRGRKAVSDGTPHSEDCGEMMPCPRCHGTGRTRPLQIMPREDWEAFVCKVAGIAHAARSKEEARIHLRHFEPDSFEEWWACYDGESRDFVGELLGRVETVDPATLWTASEDTEVLWMGTVIRVARGTRLAVLPAAVAKG
jgi:hypothetical protein